VRGRISHNSSHGMFSFTKTTLFAIDVDPGQLLLGQTEVS